MSANIVRELCRSGARYLQLRCHGGAKIAADKAKLREAAGRLGELALDSSVAIIINDSVEIAREFGFGVHVGQSDVPITKAREFLGQDAVIGLSTHRKEEWDQIDEASYLAVGPIYVTRSKKKPSPTVGPSFIRAARKMLDSRGVSMPLVAIGGITLENYRECLEAGADFAAAISVFRGSDGRLRPDAAEIAGKFQ